MPQALTMTFWYQDLTMQARYTAMHRSTDQKHIKRVIATAVHGSGDEDAVASKYTC